MKSPLLDTWKSLCNNVIKVSNRDNKMTTKQITNEMVFERLGWRRGLVDVDSDRGQYTAYFQSMGWILPDGTQWTKEGSKLDLPDPLHDLNVTFERVWPRFRNDYIRKRVKDKNATFGMIMKEVWQLCGWLLDHDNPTLAICQAFMNLPEEKK